MEVSVRCDKVPQPFTLSALDPSSSIESLFDLICKAIELEVYCKNAITVKRGFPPRPAQLDLTQSLQEAGFSMREKLIVGVDEEMA